LKKKFNCPFQKDEFSILDFLIKFGDANTEGLKLYFFDKRLPIETFKTFYEISREDIKISSDISKPTYITPKKTDIVFKNVPVIEYIPYQIDDIYHPKKFQATDVHTEYQSHFDGINFYNTSIYIPMEFTEIKEHYTQKINKSELKLALDRIIPNFIKKIEYKINQNNMFINSEKYEKELHHTV